MFRKFILKYFLLGILLIPLFSAEAAIQPLKRGINLSHWFAQTSPNSPGIPVKKEDMKQIKQAGFDHVRLPVDPTWLWTFPKKESLHPKMLKKLDAAIRLALDQNLNIVIDIHPSPKFKELLQSSPLMEESFNAFWKALATHLSQYDSQHVALEMLNEPMIDDPVQWQKIVDQLYSTMRAAAPQHTIIITGGEWSDVDALLTLTPVADSNVLYTFHFYSPHLFTHQGASWGDEVWAKVTTIPYPPTRQKIRPLIDEASDPEIRAELYRYLEAGWNEQKIAQRISIAAEWAKKHGVKLWCGEFGVYKKHVTPEDRAQYIHDTRTALETYDIGWCMWDYKGGFALFEERFFGIYKVNPLIASALGLE